MLLNQIIDIVKEAGKLMLSADFQIAEKEGVVNIVTTTDLAVQDFLCPRLAELLPGSGFLCEEKDMYDISHEYTWIIDPIDGTANFSRHIDQCAICVGLKKGEAMEIGVVYIPYTNELFTAQKGQGAFRNGEPIHVSNRTYENAILFTALSLYHKEHAKVCSDIIMDAYYSINDVRRFGAAAPEICYVAMGRAELFFEYRLSPWDFAAASLILQEAGGVITDMQGQTLSCTVPSGVVAGNLPESHQRFLEVVKKHI